MRNGNFLDTQLMQQGPGCNEPSSAPFSEPNLNAGLAWKNDRPGRGILHILM